MARRRPENPVRPLNRPPHRLDSVPQDVRAPFAHLNAETDFPDDTMSDAERAAIEADERRREAGLAPKTFVSHVEHAKIKSVKSVKSGKSVKSVNDAANVKRRKPARPSHEDVYAPFHDDLSSDDWSDEEPPATAPPADEAAVRQVWLRAQRMTQTELLLRLGLYLIASDDICGDVTVALRGREVSRSDAPKFPVGLFLREHGALRTDVPSLSADWRGRYVVRGRRFALCLASDRRNADLEVDVGAGDRLLVFGAGGMLEPTRSPAEDRAVSLVIGDAMRHRHVNPRDLTAVALPRSQAFRRLAEEDRTAPHIVAMGMSVLLVDRAGQVSGLPFLKSFESQ
jgi:hypothetical protein